MVEKIYNKLLDLIYPPKCGFCGEITCTSSFICEDCKKKYNQEYINRCKYCGKTALSHNICFECSKKKIYYERLFFCNEYTNEIRDKIHAYKFFGKKFFYNFFSELIYDKLIGIDADIIIPVPLSKERLRERGYNQSALIAKKLSKSLKIEYNGEIIVKTINNEKQSMQNFKKRQESVKNVFKIADNISVCDKKIVLIDDVFATGATVNECSRRLIESGAKSVKVAVISISHILK